MRTTLNIDDAVIAKAASLTGIDETHGGDPRATIRCGATAGTFVKMIPGDPSRTSR